MPSTTGSPFNLQYPLSSDPVNVHGDIQALAEDVAAALNGVAFKNNSNTFAATNIFSASSADPIVTVTQSGSGAAISTTGKIVAGEFELSGGTSSQFLKGDGSTDSNSYSLSSHIHGNITNDGKIGTISGLIIGTTTGGVLTNFTSAAPTSESTQFLRGDGTWVVPTDTNTTYTAGAGLTLVGTEFSVTSDTFQPLDADLTAIAGLGGTSGFLKKTAADTWTLDTTSYQASSQILTDLSGSTGITPGSSGIVRRNSNNTYSLDSSTYLTVNQEITLSGAITGSGTTTINTTLSSHKTSHEAGGTDEIVGKVITTDITPSTPPSSWAFGMNRINFVTAGGSITLPTNATHPFDVGTQIHFMSNTASALSFAATNNNAQGNKRTFAGQFAFATAIKTATNTWVVFGNLIA